MANYSHSRVSAWENCPWQYKLQYLDRVRVAVPDTVEAFLGDMVHRALYKLYRDRQHGRENTLEELLAWYHERWARDWSPDTIIVRHEYGPDDYRRRGEEFLGKYYRRYHPFDQRQVIALENQDKLALPDGNRWHVRIDRLEVDRDGAWHVCDYKTGHRLMSRAEAESDRQLALYALWVRRNFTGAEKVVLKWHFLAFDQEVTAGRTPEQLAALERETCAKIAEIEAAVARGDFPRRVGPLCDYCGYRAICPSFSHLAALEAAAGEGECRADEGLHLVDEYARTRAEKVKLEAKERGLESRLKDFAARQQVEIVYGSAYQVTVRETEKVLLPGDTARKENFLGQLREAGLFERYAMINNARLASACRNGELPPALAAALTREKDRRLYLARRREPEE